MKYLALFFLFPYFLYAQQVESPVIGVDDKGTNWGNEWVKLDSNWRYQVGDNPEWAKSDFNDSAWASINLFTDWDTTAQLHKNAPIIWFRIKLFTSNNDKPLALRIKQTGASEIYLDGQLLHQLGKVRNADGEIEFFNPRFMPLLLPLKSGKVQTLAIRFANQPLPFPVLGLSLMSSKSFLRPEITTLEYAIADPEIENRFNAFTLRHIAIGIYAILGVLYLALFIFFPTQKINFYFSIACFTGALSRIFEELRNLSHHNSIFWYNIFMYALGILSLIILLYCIFKIINQKISLLFQLLLALGFISCLLLVTYPVIGLPVFLCFLCTSAFEGIRISFIAIQKKKKGALIIFISACLTLLSLLVLSLSLLNILNFSQLIFLQLADLFTVIGFAIYLGYDYGLTNSLLKKNLKDVESLSIEKQNILASQNEILEREVANRTAELNQSLENLKQTQNQLIQSEKLASLGELTAGIAHEIQNPLNFVNNFSELSVDLANDLKEEMKRHDKNEGYIEELLTDLTQNQEKINHHGKRASNIVKGMLEHSRTSSGERVLTDINALCDEYLRLSYHGMRAKDKSFNADFKTDFDPNLPPISIVSQDIGRVLLNLVNNAFYAVNQAPPAPDGGAIPQRHKEPLVIVSTRYVAPPSGAACIISVKDNGNGISDNIKAKIFQPFFTTKPTGQGTGLGLSLSYDIVTKGHGGTLEVQSVENEGSTFVLTLPIK